jgi:succinate dehydrogenase/fumarate reductase flavoprotein subunit
MCDFKINPIFRVLGLLFSLFLVGCGSDIIVYKPLSISNTQEASKTVEELTMSQPTGWRPDNIQIKDDYIYWSFGKRTECNQFAGCRTYEDSKRIYYSSIKNIQLMSWHRKFKKWYVVSIIGKDDGVIMHVFYTRDEDEGKHFADALNSVIFAHLTR